MLHDEEHEPLSDQAPEPPASLGARRHRRAPSTSPIRRGFFVARKSPKGTEMDKVRIFDTTLRDGEQSHGISLNVPEKVEIAEQLARLGVDIIEGGFPISSDGDFESVTAIAQTVKGPVIAGLSRTAFADVDRCWEAVRHAERNRIHVFVSTSAIHMETMLRMTPEQVKKEAIAAVARAKSYTPDADVSPRHANRTEP